MSDTARSDNDIIQSYQHTTMDLMGLVLHQVFDPAHVEIENQSSMHKGHREAMKQPLKGHFSLHITCSNLGSGHRVKQHRMIYHALRGLMHRIHALSLHVNTVIDGNLTS